MGCYGKTRPKEQGSASSWSNYHDPIAAAAFAASQVPEDDGLDVGVAETKRVEVALEV